MRPPRVLFVIHANPAAYPPVERAVRVLRDAGAEVRILGVVGDVTDAFDATRDETLDVHLYPRGRRGLRAKLRYAMFMASALVHCARWRPTWVYLSDTLTTPLARLARLSGARIVYHEHDVPDVSSPTVFMRLLLRARERAIRGADLVVTPNVERSNALEGIRRRPVHTVWNCPHPEEVRARRHRPHADDFRILYQGSVSPARLPLALVDAMAATPSFVRLFIRAYETEGSRGYLERFFERAGALGIGGRLTRLPPVPREAMLDFAASCDLGLALMPMSSSEPNERTMAGASNKAFEYLACGVPLLVSDLSDWRRIFVDAGVGVACDAADSRSIAAALARAVDGREALVEMGARGRRLVERQWNYPKQFASVAALVVGSPPGVSGKSAHAAWPAGYVRS